LTALGHYISACGGSRGVRAICSEAGTRCPDAKVEDLSRFRFVEEQTKNRNEKLIVSRVDDGISISAVSVDLTLEVKREFFEKGWV
jgi:succinate dehydrogenase / fumarate reductase flavoprotein subunit